MRNRTRTWDPPGPIPDTLGEDAFVTKVSADGSTILYSTYLGGDGDDLGAGIAVDSHGDAFVAGITDSDNFPAVNAYQAKYGSLELATPRS